MLVVDASVAAKWFFAEEFSAEAERLQASGQAVIAPDIAVIELMNTVWKRFARGQISKAHASSVCLKVASCFTSLEPIARLWSRAGEIALAANHPIYDCLYLALAERERVPLITVDRRLIEAGHRLGTAKVRHLADF